MLFRSPTAKDRTIRATTPYVPPAPIENNATMGWDGFMTSTINTHNTKVPSLPRHFASAFAPGQRGFHHHPHSLYAPKDEYSSPHHRTTAPTTTNITTTSNVAGGYASGDMATTYTFRETNNNHNCMSSCSSSSSSLSNDTLFVGAHNNFNNNHKRPMDYEQHEV